MNILDYIFAQSVMQDAEVSTDANQDFILDETIEQQGSSVMPSTKMAKLGALTNTVFHHVAITDAIVVNNKDDQQNSVFDFSKAIPTHH